MSTELLAVARCLAVDGITAEVSRALTSAGVRHVLIKGPTLAHWLYAQHEVRAYADADLLLDPARYSAGEQVLRDLGFVSDGATHPPERGLPHSEPWQRGLAAVDVHRTLFGAAAPPPVVWDALPTTTMDVGGTSVDVPTLPGRALIAALHAAQHDGEAKSVEDLRRATTHADVWPEARALAARIGASHTLAQGLRLVDPHLADDLPSVMPTAQAPLVVGVERLRAARGTERVRLLARELVPTRAELREWSPLARRGRLGTALAYAYRPLWLVRHAPASVRAWRRARR